MTSLLSRMFCTIAFLLTIVHSSTGFGAALTWTGTGNWNTAGNWGGSVPTTGDTGDISSGTATANVTLPGSPAISVTGTGVLFLNGFAGPLTDSGTVLANTGGRVDFQGNSADTSLITLEDGAEIGSPQNNVIATSNNALNLTTGATVTVSSIRASVTRTNLGLNLSGPLSSDDSTATLLVQPASGVFLGPVVLAPSAANTGFTGDVSIQEGAGSTIGTLALSGTGALSNVSNVIIGSGAQLRFAGAADPFASGKVIQVPTGANIDWEGSASSYSMAQALRPTLIFHDGSTFGREEISNVLAISRENVRIGNAANATVSTGRIKGSVTRTNLALDLRGALSSFDNTSTLLVQSDANNPGALNINPSTNNLGFTGNIDIQEGASSTVSTLVLSGTGALSNVNNITMGNNTILRFNSATNPLPSGFAISVGAGRRIEWEGTGGSYSVTPPTITFLDGSTFGREEAQNSLGIGRANLVIDAGATVTASRINASVPRTSLGLELRGSLASGNSSSTLIIDPTTANFKGGLTLNPSSPNAFDGHVIIQPGPGGSTPGSLILSGTGALANVSSLTVNSGTILRFWNAENPLPDAFAINIPSGGRMEWEGTGNTYTGITAPTITFQDGSEFGRVQASNALSISRDNLVIAPGATVTVSDINTTLSRFDLALRLQGTLSGGADTKIVYQGTAGANFGPLTINPSVANTFAGTFELRGFDALNQAALVLQGTGPLANASLLDIDQFSTAMVITTGAGDDIGEIRVQSGGTFRLRDNAVSTLTNTTLTGGGRVRSEAFEDEMLIDQPLRPLTLNEVIVAPGLSAGTLTFETTQLTLGTNSQLDIELGSLSDQIVIEGDLVLDSSTTLNLSGLSGLNVGEYIIATSNTGSITGTFGEINALFPGPFVFEGITYGSNFISVTIGAVPEPSTGLLGGLGCLAGMMIRRRRRGAKA